MQPVPDKRFALVLEARGRDEPSAEIDELRDDTELRAELLASVKPFNLFDERWLGVVATLMVEEACEVDQMIYRAGEASEAAYLVREGEIAIYTDTVGEPVRLVARVKPGELFGEVGVLEQHRRETSARVTRKARVLRLEGEDLLRLGRAHPRFGLKLVHCALLRCMREQSKALDLGRRDEVRVRIGSPALVVAGDREPLCVELENLSVGGCCLRGIPETWHLYESTPISVRLEDGTALLESFGRIAWRRDGRVGIAFTAVSRDHSRQVELALELLFDREKRPSPDESAAFELHSVWPVGKGFEDSEPFDSSTRSEARSTASRATLPRR